MQVQPEYGDEQTDAERDWFRQCRETKFSGANGDMEIFIFSVQLNTRRIGNLTRLILTLLDVMTIHTCLHAYIGSTVVVRRGNGSVSYSACTFLRLSFVCNLLTAQIAIDRLPILPTCNIATSCLWSLRIFPPLPGSRLRIFIAMQDQHSYTSSTNNY